MEKEFKYFNNDNGPESVASRGPLDRDEEVIELSLPQEEIDKAFRLIKKLFDKKESFNAEQNQKFEQEYAKTLKLIKEKYKSGDFGLNALFLFNLIEGKQFSPEILIAVDTPDLDFTNFIDKVLTEY